jgi:hypothetical protein
MLAAAVVGALIILIIVAAWLATNPDAAKWTHFEHWRAEYSASPDEIYEQSAGGFDEAAALALSRSETAARLAEERAEENARGFAPAERPEACESVLCHRRAAVGHHRRAATIIFRNIVSQEHRLAPAAVGGGAADAPADAGDGAVRTLDREEAELRLEMFEQARRHFAAALGGLTREYLRAEAAAAAAARVARNRRRAAPARAGESAPAPPDAETECAIDRERMRELAQDRELIGAGAEPLLDGAQEFAQEGLAALLANDPVLLAGTGLALGLGAGGLVILGAAVDEELDALARSRRERTVEARRAAAAAQAAKAGAGRGAAAELYLELSEQHTSDPQNSHDPGVNAAKRAVVARLRADQGAEELPTLGAIAAEIEAGRAEFSRDPRTGRARPVLVQRALDAVERARAGERSMAAGASDEEVLRRVWARAGDPRNRERRAQLQQAVFDALVSSWERGIGRDELQCVDGRIARYVGALALLDWDARNWGAQRLEDHKNEVFRRARATIRAAAGEAAASPDARLQAVGRAYLAKSPRELAEAGEVDSCAEEEWAASVRARIEADVDAYAAEASAAAAGAIPAYAVEVLKKEACAAVGP